MDVKDLKKIAKNMRKFNNINDVVNNILGSLEKKILDMNRDQMYEDGVMDINKPNSILKYAPSTIKNKKTRAAFPKTDFITLRWNDDFHPSLKIFYKKDSFLIYSDNQVWTRYLKPDTKTSQGRFGNALGLTDESLALLRDWVASKMIKQFRDAV